MLVLPPACLPSFGVHDGGVLGNPVSKLFQWGTREYICKHGFGL